jgi:signal transduction histidine kinase/CheY-like chemotaxis protein
MNGKRFSWPLLKCGILPRTAISIAGIAVLVGIVSIAVTVAVTYTRTNTASRTELNELLDTVEDTIRVACFVEDSALATEIAKGMLKNGRVFGVVIRVGPRKLAAAYRGGALPPVSDSTLTRTVVSPFDKAKVVGVIDLIPDPRVAAQRVRNDVAFVCILLCLQWLVLGGGLLMLVLRNVVRPIKIISDTLHRMDAEGGAQLLPPHGQEYSEIGRLVRDINELASRLVASIHHGIDRTRELEKAKSQVEAQTRQLKLKNTALANSMQLQEEVERIARHDLKTPLGSIAAIPALLRKRGNISKEEDELLTIIETSARRVLRMVSLSLDIFRMEQGVYVFKPEVVDIAELISVVVQDLRSDAEAKGVSIQIVECAANPCVLAEEVLCYSIFANLIKNAVEASPNGMPVRISIASMPQILVSINNHGVVPDRIRTKFFEKYSTSGKASGTGLGTYSAWLMTRIQGGTITMETTDNDGTTLSIELKQASKGQCGKKTIAVRNGAAAMKDADMVVPPLHVLLVDDDPSNTIIMKRMLPSPPLTIETASNGLDAFEKCILRRPDVIFMDIEMPIMGGFESLKKIRSFQLGTTLKPSKIIAFSAHDDEMSRIRSIAEGFDMHLSKPSSLGEILAVMIDAKPGGQDLIDANFPVSEPEESSNTIVWVDAELLSLIPEFIVSRLNLLAELRDAAKYGCRGKYYRLCHKLKGGFGLYGFRWAAAVSGELEGTTKIDDLDNVISQIDGLELYLKNVEVRQRTSLSGALNFSQ